MYPTHDIARDMNRVQPGLDDAQVRALYDIALRHHDAMRQVSDPHPGYCRCQPCEWLDPTSGRESWHGTGHGYKYYKCRCERCKREHRNQSRIAKIRKG